MTGAVHRARRVTMWSLACSLLLGWFGAFSGVATSVTENRFELVPAIAAGVGMIVFSVAILLLVRAVSVGWTGDPRPSRRYAAIAGAAAVFIMLVQNASPAGWGLIAICWVSLAAIRTGRAGTVLIAGGTVVTCSALYWVNPGHEGLPTRVAVFIYLVMCLTLPYANRLWIWILDLTETAHAGKDAEARLAVTEERLRFARDLHDLVGHSLSVIAVKSELAGKLVSRDADRAANEMAQVRGLAQDGLRQIREAVRGYRVLDLADEIASVRAILEADGIRCTVDLPSGVVDPAAAGPLAWVVRECATNILRHSSATWCTVTLRAADGSAVLEVVNDGAPTTAQPGNGLAGLSERLTATGGS
ncbi:sensor histidine kinase [Actinoplanes couchii]|uniref:Signal transduction histidine kinase subgroup 3 dimerisation and phosphoacceptor domain-containing protein n=1 Tax=Actinoplanes couchii TaxID=403638 RepID=A0ABQ3X722_9ACTN|nr:histidine kinase [Actinoplanes couchii]MDR6322119.1 two-component system sensor histidine kinase DesK [Actinoplanes couchii]GID54284.1 hypothetical protein Aco03nite_026880 [Actinoplanes couchii]